MSQISINLYFNISIKTTKEGTLVLLYASPGHLSNIDINFFEIQGCLVG